ncbi:MAG: phosphotransferase [Cyanobacteria bacterium P01_A01_bin.68]
MLFSLSSHNVIQYLHDAGLCSSEDGASADSELPHSRKNSNFLVTLADNCKLLVKQKRGFNCDDSQKELFKEWLFHELLKSFPVLGNIFAIASTVQHFDEENSILVRTYLKEYIELENFYHSYSTFSDSIATAIGNTLGALHRATFNSREYREFMAQEPAGVIRYNYYNPAQGIGLITPDMMSRVSTDALEFYTLYQQYDFLESAIADLANNFHACCLTHNNLNLTNILLHSKWEHLDNCLIKIIDWEACGWGDPAFELGNVVASYLKLWLESVVVEVSIDFEESLELAVTPLETLQPSILTLVRTYLQTFPRIMEYRQDFILQIVQFAGLALMKEAEAKIQYGNCSQNMSIGMLKVAKNLLAMPQLSVKTVFGVAELEITQSVTEVKKLPQNKAEDNLLPIFYEKTRLRGC